MASDTWSAKDISCPVCLGILANPTTLPCGHNFCIDCITKCWEAAGSTGACCCPVCRYISSQPHPLRKNTMLEKMVEKLRSKVPDAPPSRSHGGPGDAVCDVCTERNKLEAVKRCEECKMSYCQSHLSTHLLIPALQRHVLVDVVQEIQEKTCPRHDRLLDMYCREDRKCICHQCDAEEHQGHETVSVETERARRQDELIAIQRRSSRILEEREKLLRTLEETVVALKGSAQSAEDDSDRMLAEMIQSMEERRGEVTEGIRRRERALVGRAEGVKTRLQHDITVLQRRSTTLDELSSTTDSTLFLQRWQPISNLPERNPNITISEKASFEVVKTVINEFKVLFDDLSRDLLHNFGHELENVHILESPDPLPKPQDKQVRRANSECQGLRPPIPPRASMRIAERELTIPPGIPRTRTDFLQYVCQLTLDPKTAHRNLVLSDDNRKVAANPKSQSRFPKSRNHQQQVLCREGLTGGRFYWEAEWSGKGVFVGVTYQGTERKEGRGQCGLGNDVKSWSLHCSQLHYSAWHNNMETRITTTVSSPRIGVYLDHRAGTLDFYGVSGSMVLLHRFSLGDFSETLYAGFGVEVQSSVKLLQQHF